MGKGSALVTGAAGFIGSHVVDRCLDLGMDVVAVDDLSGGFRDNVPTRARWVQGDLRNPEFVAGLWNTEKFDYVYHLAAYAAEGLSHFIRRYNYDTNLLASINLINMAVKHEVQCFVFTSSIAVYGRDQLPMTEEIAPEPEDPYGISKYAVELDLRCAKRLFGLNYVIFRPHNVYGERQNIGDKYRNAIGIFMNQVLRGQPMTVFGDGLQTRAFSHVDDTAPLIARAPLVPSAINETFNIGAEARHTVRAAAEAVAAAFNVPCNIKYLPPRNEAFHAFSTHAKIETVFRPPPSIELNTGISRMAEWAKQRGPAMPFDFRDIELHKNLPSSWAHS